MYFPAWIAGGAPSAVKPWLAIAMEAYFKYDIYAAGLIVLFTKGIRAAHKLGWIPSLGLGVAAVIVYQGVFFVFNRERARRPSCRPSRNKVGSLK